MAEQNETDLPAGNDGVVSRDAQPVCPKCFEPYDPPQDYCVNCDSNEPLSLLSAYVPFVRIRFTAGVFGKMWRMIWRDETSIAIRIFLLLFIAWGAPIILMVGLPLLLISKIKNDILRRITTVAFFAFLAVLIALYADLI